MCSVRLRPGPRPPLPRLASCFCKVGNTLTHPVDTIATATGQPPLKTCKPIASCHAGSIFVFIADCGGVLKPRCILGGDRLPPPAGCALLAFTAHAQTVLPSPICQREIIQFCQAGMIPLLLRLPFYSCKVCNAHCIAHAVILQTVNASRDLERSTIVPWIIRGMGETVMRVCAL